MDTRAKEERIERFLQRKAPVLFPSPDEVKRRLSKEKLTFYLGIDPTGSHIHLGHTIPLLTLKDLSDLGHSIILLVGDFTAQIGDPTDRTAARQALTKEQIEQNMATYLDQVQRILPPGSFEVHYNSEWLAPMSFEEIVKLSSHVTVQQMIQRDMFQERIAQEKPIYLHEFLYPLMQGYDSVVLRVDGEVGGNDQTFNMLIGRELEREFLGKDKIVIATRLLVNATTGKKMSKSEGTLIAIDDPPQEIRRKILDLDDSMIITTFQLCTTIDDDTIEKYRTMLSAGENPKQVKELLAAELIRMYHGDSAVALATEAIATTATGSLDKVLKESGVAQSLSEAKRLVEQGGVTLNGSVVTRWDISVASGDELRIGKGKYIRVVS